MAEGISTAQAVTDTGGVDQSSMVTEGSGNAGMKAETAGRDLQAELRAIEIQAELLAQTSGRGVSLNQLA